MRQICGMLTFNYAAAAELFAVRGPFGIAYRRFCSAQAAEAIRPLKRSCPTARGIITETQTLPTTPTKVPRDDQRPRSMEPRIVPLHGAARTLAVRTRMGRYVRSMAMTNHSSLTLPKDRSAAREKVLA
jgi:hypothetical protein